MPPQGQFLPRKSSAHRIACIALYRALLRQCPRIPIPDDVPLRGKTNPLKHFIQKTFRNNSDHTSPRLVVPALQTGYAVHSLLQHAASSPPNSPNPSLSQIHTLLLTLSESYTSARISCPPKPRIERRDRERYPGAPKVIDVRPLPKEKLTGLRRVPTLVAVHSTFSYMRFKKPQSPFLSRVLTQKVKRKQRRHSKVEELEDLTSMGMMEDAWDSIIENGDQRKDGPQKISYDDVPYLDSWAAEPTAQTHAIWESLTTEAKEAKKLGLKMVDIIAQEKKLWGEERKERKHLKNQERRKKREERSAQEEKESKTPL